MPKINFRKKLTNGLIILAFLLIGQPLLAQVTEIKGKITDSETAEPIPFANVFFPGTTVGATTDFDGNYSISTQMAGDSLKVMVVGYITKARKIKKKP